MDRKQKRDAKNARHRANEIRRLNRRMGRGISPLMPLIREAQRFDEFRRYQEMAIARSLAIPLHMFDQ